MSGSIDRNKKDMNSSKDVDEKEEGIGQAKLYSPHYAIRIHTNQQNNNNNNNNQEGLKNHNNSMAVIGMDLKKRMGMVKERLMEKLAGASVPSDALENAKLFIESVIKDVTSAAQGLTKDALQKIKSHLADLFPSLSPSFTSKMVDDAAKESADDNEESRNDDKEKESSSFSNAHISKL